MVPIIKKHEGCLSLTWGSVSATIPDRSVFIGHLGCKQLATIEGVSESLKLDWDRRIGRDWRKKGNATGKLATALKHAITTTHMDGAVLWDTMRKGSDYWRPGNLLSKVVEATGNQNISYARNEMFCPPQSLLEKFMVEESKMRFADYAERYAEFLREGDTLDQAVASVMLGLAKSQLPIFYCIDPYIPGYSKSIETLSTIPYIDRYWEPELPREGCHRVILVEEICKKLISYGASVTVIEVDANCQRSHSRLIN